MNTVSIAIADDHILVRKALVSYLSCVDRRYSFVIEADNGYDLITRIGSSTEKPRICLLDISMPVLNGFDTILELKKKWPDIRVIALSMYDHDEYVVKIMRNGANGFVGKSDGVDTLIRAIEMVNKVGYYHSENVTRLLYENIHKRIVDLEIITERERCYLKHCCSDLSHKDIAVLMKTTPKGVDGYRDSLFKKLNVNSRYSLILFAIKHGFFNINIDKNLT